ncbi:MAG: DUF3047 domain-containing protein [Gammaproteobacteria bacterium]
MFRSTNSLWFVLMITVAGSSLAENRVDVLAPPDLSQWENETFSGETSYEVVEQNGNPVIKAVSKGTASGLVRRMTIDLNKTPYMNWSWKVDNILTGVDETRKSGDDYAARVYVVISGGIFFWRTRAISYAWTSQQPEGNVWPNAFTGSAVMVAAQFGEEKVGQWVKEKRNILDDIKNLLDLDKTQINAVAIMTDTDNSEQSATAYYGNIYFTAE